MEPEVSLKFSQKPTKSEALCNISQHSGFCGEDFLAPSPNVKLEDHPLSAVHNWLFSTFLAIFHIWRMSLLSATWGCVFLLFPNIFV